MANEHDFIQRLDRATRLQTLQCCSLTGCMGYVVITGDPTLDWAVEVALMETHSDERLTQGSSICCHQGGALLLRSLVAEVVGEQKVRGMKRFRNCPTPSQSDVHHTFGEVGEFPQFNWSKRDAIEKPEKTLRYRGYFGRKEESRSLVKTHGLPDSATVASASLICIDDAGLGFSKASHRSFPMTSLSDRKGDAPWIVYRLSGNSVEDESNTLWRKLAGDRVLTNRLVIVAPVEALRTAGAEVSAGSSWECTAQDLLAELRRNTKLNDLNSCKRLVVVFGTTGALFVDQETHQRRLFYHKRFVESSWSWSYEKEHGRLFGYSEIVTAEIARSLYNTSFDVASDVNKDIHECISAGLKKALPKAWIAYGKGFRHSKGNSWLLEYPTECMRDECIKKTDLAEKFADCEVETDSRWSILTQNIDQGGDGPFSLARQVARQGKKILPAPYAEFHGLISVDRREIEGLRSLRRLISSYLMPGLGNAEMKPRSVAILGRPGDGKSFSVREIAAELAAAGRANSAANNHLEFNLSQFDSADDLADAFHLVRDKCLKDDTPPVVFFDEFDTDCESTPLGWLRHFLVPMQDGFFMQGQLRHPIGRAVFVFAGGVFQRFDDFQKAAEQDKEAKGTDFISRLSGYLDVASLNPEDGTIELQPNTIIRRALLLHGYLKHSPLNKPERIDDDVLRAFLQIPKYRYGARSMGTIVRMSDLHPNGRFSRSCLPPANELNLHVDAKRFLDIARKSPQP